MFLRGKVIDCARWVMRVPGDVFFIPGGFVSPGGVFLLPVGVDGLPKFILVVQWVADGKMKLQVLETRFSTIVNWC